MERESLLLTLIILLGGLVLQLFAAWPGSAAGSSAARQRERALWFALWWPVAPALTVAAWLCGWALSQPDPVPDHVGYLIFIAAAPFAVVGLRALLRALWSLCRSSHPYRGIATVGLLRPRILVPRELAAVLDAGALHAALTHEQMHVRHRDPLRIWLAQLVTDLQWPWPPAARRFESWLEALEIARDDEARSNGVGGADLAAAVLGSLRFELGSRPVATLIGRPDALPARIARLLCPLPESKPEPPPLYLTVASGLAMTWLMAAALGLWFGPQLISALLAFSS
ncbi:MAG: hypothetical protein JOZ93_07260 [Sinobacteraceae bacterium]|nr:hypothetical protein [Nevskiaceae bacterium]MBV9912357.1 hypothetical protein [Nevskiaceae bacterium]